ncbi:hypothetical protein AXF42_Ash006282 [Apostasia shenzhenica]|uniref:Uncharacterized protein n=1 Tax=Apostasia shenzhenica TaxID=1088818 RepID=A0A2I0AYP0_9ASPA|nr:hypothetical protein AXF42_Ash006282 [Apostasia shenzhenica]
MAKFNQIQKARREWIQNQKRALHGDPNTRKLRQKIEAVPISGKRKRKLLKKWRREQKEALEKGLVTMKDIEMAVVDGTSQKDKEKAQRKFNVKKASRLRIKGLKRKGRADKKSSGRTDNTSLTDVMVVVDAH